MLPPSSKKSELSVPVIRNSDYPVIGSTVNEQLEELIKKVMTKHGVCSEEYLNACIEHRKQDKETQNNLLATTTLSAEMLNETIQKLCVQINRLWALKETGTPNVDKVMAFN